MEDLSFDGQQVRWGALTFPASSGLPDVQDPIKQCAEGGPIPEGIYSFLTRTDAIPARLVAETCRLIPAAAVQEIPAQSYGDPCNDVYSAWGRHRVRLKALDDKAIKACKSNRDGFYIHDSTKGYSHGCIEVTWQFVYELGVYRAMGKAKSTLAIRVQYNGLPTSHRKVQR